MARPRFRKVPAVAPDLVNDQRSRAWKAVRNFNKLVPTLTSYARQYTGNSKVRVMAGPRSQTDGKTIWIRPSLAMAEELSHKPSVCDQRDSDYQMICPACRVSEETWRKLYHEISHIAGGSIAAPTRRVVAEMHELINEWHPKNACSHAANMMALVSEANDYLPMFGYFDRVIPMLSQSVEDARVDSHMVAVNPGLRAAFYANTFNIFQNGCEQDDGSYMVWRDQPTAAQIIIGVMLIASGYDIQPDWLRPEVIELLEDEEIRVLVRGMSEISVEDHAIRVIEIYRRLYNMGIHFTEKCVPVDDTEDSDNSPDGNVDGNVDDNDDDSNDDDEGNHEEPSESGDNPPGGDPDPDDAGETDEGDSGDDGSGHDADDKSGDGTTGNSASGGAFGKPDDPSASSNSDSGGEREDQEGGADDTESEGSSVPDDDGDDRQDDGGESRQSGESDATDDAESLESGGDDSSDAGREASSQDENDADLADPEEGGSDSTGSPAEAGDAGPAGERDASDGDGNGDGEPDSEDESDESGGGDPEDQGESVSDSGTESDEEADVLGDEDDSEDGEPLGEDVWNQESRDPLRAARSIGGEDLGDIEKVEEALKVLTIHEDPHVAPLSTGDGVHDEEDIYDEVAVAADKALTDSSIQAQFFDRASQHVSGVREYTFPSPTMRWIPTRGGASKDFIPSESILGPALLVARKAFSENARTRREQHLKSGRVNGRVLGKRAPLMDERLFTKRHLPRRRDYVVGITIDCSGSNHYNRNMEKAKRAVFAKAELLSRLGIKFYITAHTGGIESWMTHGWEPDKPGDMHDLWIFWVKKLDEPWNDKTRDRLAAVQPTAENYDGHTLEFHRKVLQSQRATDKILIYYTDGAMPAANYDEELVILLDEIQKCKREKITLLAVGIETNSPASYGFKTVQVNSDADVAKVVASLEEELVR